MGLGRVIKRKQEHKTAIRTLAQSFHSKYIDPKGFC